MMGDETKVSLDRQADGHPVPQLVNSSLCEKNVWLDATGQRAGRHVSSAAFRGKTLVLSNLKSHI
jgi:hypothetical protein